MVLENPQLGVKNVAFLTPNTPKNTKKPPRLFIVSAAKVHKKRSALPLRYAKNRPFCVLS
jgi:hypothetical protein